MKQAILLSGYFEQKKRNPAFGALLLVLIVGAIYFAAGELITYIVISFSGLTSSNQQIFNTYKYAILILTSLFQFLIMLPLTVRIGKKWFTENIFIYMGYGNISLRGIALGALLGIAIIPPALFLGDYFYNLFPGIKKLLELSGTIFQAHSGLELAFLIFTIGLTPAICEETLFRGIFLRTLSRRLPFSLSIVLGGILFTLFHSSVLSLPSIFIAGLSLGITYALSDSIYPAIALHCFYNSGQVLLANNILGTSSLLFDTRGNLQKPILGISLLVITFIIILMSITSRKASVHTYYLPVAE